VPRDGRTLEEIGRYNPQMEPSLVEIDADRAREWISRGAQPTETVRKLLRIAGV
jgi:small subunit ribosomal protein S16